MSDATVQDEPKKEERISQPPVPKKEPEQQVSVKTSLTGDCVFNDSITVYSGNRLPQYDKGTVKAYTAVGRDKAPRKLFALICDDALSPRTHKALNYVSILNPALPRLVGSGIIDWALEGKEKYCFVYEDILGNPLMKDDTKGGLGLKPEYVTSAVIRPMVSVFQDLRDKDLTHGNIRPANIFDGGIKNFQKVVLGECLSMPSSYNQPVLYETIDRALCSPAGRGKPSMEDDLYSFGVTLALLLRHLNPVGGFSDEEIIEHKMEEGSYMTLLGKDRFSGAILELLRGLLYDDEGQRWTLDDVLVWMDGRRLSPKQTVKRSKASRPLTFNGQKYTRPEFIARDLNKNIADAKSVIDSGEMDQWLKRALEDKEITQRCEKAILLSTDGGTGVGYPERLVTRMAIALHPEGPLRYKTISVRPDGVGGAFTEAYVQKRDVQTYSDFFAAYFITQWVDSQPKIVSDISSLVSRFDGARAFLRQGFIGGGIERCIYWLNPETHCLSEKLSKFHVRSPEDMMQAFEKISTLPSRPAYFFDRHIAAFLLVKDSKNIEPYMHELNAPEPYKRVLGELKTLSNIQRRSQLPPFPGIATWIFDNLEPVYERFHDRELRADLKRKIEKLKETGDIEKIANLFDEVRIQKEDNINFRKSMRYYYNLKHEKEKIDFDLKNNEIIGQGLGRQISAVFSAILAGIIILATFFLTHKGGSLF